MRAFVCATVCACVRALHPSFSSFSFSLTHTHDLTHTHLQSAGNDDDIKRTHLESVFEDGVGKEFDAATEKERGEIRL